MTIQEQISSLQAEINAHYDSIEALQTQIRVIYNSIETPETEDEIFRQAKEYFLD